MRRRPLATALLLGALTLGVGPVSDAGAARITRQLTPVEAAPAPSSSAAPTTAPTPIPAAAGVPAPPVAPLLRVDAEFHTQVVNRFAQDSRGRIIATASDDKTIRIWQASDGSPLATLRVPIATGDEGALYAVAISPDGNTLLAGGNTGVTWDRAVAVYLFDLTTGRMKGRMPNLPGPVNDIAFSPDGSAIAIAMGNRGGVWIVDATNGRPIGSDSTFRDRVTSLAYDHRGRLFATGYDGDVRLYDPAGRRLAQRTPVPGAHPYSIAVSADDRTVAVGYADQPRVEVLNAQDLASRASLTTDPSGRRETGGGGLGAVAFSSDGVLMAAGTLRGRDGNTVLRRWSGPNARPVDWPALRDTVFQIGATPDGGALLVGADPALVRLDNNGRVVFRKEGPGLDFRDVQDRTFRVSTDGLSVVLQTKTMPTQWTVDLGQRRVGPTGTRGLTPVSAPVASSQPVPAGPPPTVTGWRNGSDPRVGGQSVSLAPEELSRSYAATPSGDMVVLGSDYQLRVVRRDGVMLDQVELPGAAWAVGVSGDQTVVVAAVSDGTLRWFGLSRSGQLTPRVSLFMTADSRRWVAWTASGFFDYADTGGEGLVGVLLNHARNQAPEWFSFAQVFRRFYAPDTVASRLRGGTEPDPASGLGDVRQTLAKTPPPNIDLRAICWKAGAGQQCQPVAASSTSRSLTAVAAADVADITVPPEAGDVTLQYRLKGDGAKSSAVDLFLNGHNGGRAVREVTSAGDVTVEQSTALDPGMNRLQLRAYDSAQQTYAQSRQLQIQRSAPVEARSNKPTLFVLSVGINDYASAINHLNFAVPDAKSVTKAIKAHVPDSYGQAEVTELYDAAASTDAVIKALADISSRATGADTVLIYLSGHGTSIDERYYFITQNVHDGEDKTVQTSALSEGALITALGKVKSNHTMLFLDTCHAGAFSLDAASKLAHETGRYILAGSASIEAALDSYDDKNGIFATAILRGLSGQAASGKPIVNNFDLGLFVTPLVHELAGELRHEQSARFKIAADDAQPFPIVTLKGAAAAR